MSNYWNEIREMSVLEKILKIKPLWLKTQHAIQCSPLIILYFKNRNWPVVRLKWLFPWFFVSVLIFDLECVIWWSVYKVTFCEFHEKQGTRVKTQGFIKKDCFFFLAPILLSCIVISSFIHEVVTLMEKLFKFWECHLWFRLLTWSKWAFQSTWCRLWFMAMKKKENSQA